MTERKVSIIGVGNAGGCIVDALVRHGPGTTAAAVNTDGRALAELEVATKVQIGAGRTGGIGTGGDAAAGRAAAEADVHLLRSLVGGMDTVILVAGLGGGTGNGALPVLVETARQERALSLVVGVLPLEAEGSARGEAAVRALKALRSAADAVVAVRADRLFECAAAGSLPETFEKGDRILAQGVFGLWLMLTRPRLIDVDFAHLKRVSQEKGAIATFGYGEGRGEKRAAAAVSALCSNPLLAKGSLLKTARAAVVSIVGGADLTLKDVDDAMTALRSRVPADCRLAMGTALDEDLEGRIVLTAVVSEPWDPLALEEIGGESPAVPEPASAAEPKAKAASARKPGKPQQTRLVFETPGKGRFKNVEPTLLNGEDVDIPTFIRRGIPIAK